MSTDPDPARDVLSRRLFQFVTISGYPRFQRSKWCVTSATTCFSHVYEASRLPSVFFSMVQSVLEKPSFHASLEGDLDGLGGGVRILFCSQKLLRLLVFLFPEHTWDLSPVTGFTLPVLLRFPLLVRFARLLVGRL